ncbi:MAG: response regulator [Candidatus Poribacteria bacterium]|nr:response regulator [Candidatus Poribacteria bacterium]
MNPLNILAVDDELFICELLADMLQHQGHKTTTATDSREALALFEQNEYDIVFTDYRMPHLDGLELARRMKTLKPTVPICLISGTLDELQPEPLEIFDAVVRKPFVSDDLTAAIDRALMSPSPFVPNTIRAPRYHVHWRVHYIPLEWSLFVQPFLEPRRTELRNLTEGGLAFVAPEELIVSGLCAFVIYPPKNGKPFLAVGQILWQREIEGQKIAGTKWLLWESDQERDFAVASARAESLENASP